MDIGTGLAVAGGAYALGQFLSTLLVTAYQAAEDDEAREERRSFIEDDKNAG